MFGPMFLMPGQDDAPGNLTVNYYLDGQSIGGTVYTLAADVPLMTLYPTLSTLSGSGGQASYNNFTHPITGFADGWRDENGIVYSGHDIASGGWVVKTNKINKPLGPIKGMIELDTISPQYISLGVNIGGSHFDAVFMQPSGEIYEYFNVERNNIPHPFITNINSTISVPTTITGRYIGMTVEFT